MGGFREEILKFFEIFKKWPEWSFNGYLIKKFFKIFQFETILKRETLNF